MERKRAHLVSQRRNPHRDSRPGLDLVTAPTSSACNGLIEDWSYPLQGDDSVCLPISVGPGQSESSVLPMKQIPNWTRNQCLYATVQGPPYSGALGRPG